MQSVLPVLLVVPTIHGLLPTLSLPSTQGRQLLEELQNNIISYGPCWQRAVDGLQTSCSALTEENQHRLALDFTTCFVQKLGHEGYSCPASKAISECDDFKKLSSSSHLSTYSTFFTHSQVICSFLQQQKWQKNTLSVINALSESSMDLSTKLNDLNSVMDSTRQDQSRLQELTRVALDANNELSTKLQSQGSSLSIMLDQIHYVNNVIAGHASTLSSFAYFAGGILISFLLTTPEQTRSVRSWLLLLFTTNLLIELAILQWALEVSGLGHEFFRSSSIISFRLSICRRIFCCLSFVLYIYKAITYRSPEEHSHKLLWEVSIVVNQLDSRLQRIESALSSAAAKVRKTYDCRDSPLRYRETTPLTAPLRRCYDRAQSTNNESKETKENLLNPRRDLFKTQKSSPEKKSTALRRSNRKQNNTDELI